MAETVFLHSSVQSRSFAPSERSHRPVAIWLLVGVFMIMVQIF
jgi:hypothetical protein